MKNPYNFFSSDYYKTSQIDTMVYNITVSGVTQQQLDDATETFRTDSEIDVIYTDTTSIYLTLEEINSAGSAYTDGFIYSPEIDFKIAGFMTSFLTSPEIDTIFSGFTAELLSESEAQIQIDNGTEVSMDYWHPAPYYERTLLMEESVTIGNEAGNSITSYISGNTYWERTNSGPIWLSYALLATEGTGTTELTFQATQNNSDASRYTTIFFDSDDVVNMPISIRVYQSGGYVAPS